MADFPATLPGPSVTGFNVSPAEGVARTEMDAGNTRARRRFVSVPDTLEVSWFFTDTEMTAFRAWYRADATAGAAGGAAWFNLDLPIGDGGIEAKNARFAEPWRADLKKGLHWQVSAKLEVR